MTGDLKKTIVFQSKSRKDRKVYEWDIYECACESCFYRDQPWVCNRVRVNRTRRGSVKGPSQANDEPCVLTCEGYQFKEWTEETWKIAQAQMWENRKTVKPFEKVVDEAYKDYLEEQKFLSGFDWDE